MFVCNYVCYYVFGYPFNYPAIMLVIMFTVILAVILVIIVVIVLTISLPQSHIPVYPDRVSQALSAGQKDSFRGVFQTGVLLCPALCL